MAQAYLRFPDLHGDQVAFCAADDVWLAPVTGGRAWRLTSDETPVANPRFSPDGSHLAWTSTRDGHWEAMVVDLAEGTPRRLTWWGAPTTRVLGWTPDGRVLVASAAGQPNPELIMVRAVGLDGTVEQTPYGPASGVALHPDGGVVVSTPGMRAPAHWKRYRGGTASKLWLDRTGTGENWEAVLPEVEAGLVSPQWRGDELIFASDLEASLPGNPDGQANLYSLDVLGDAPTDPVRLSEHTVVDGYVRDPRTDGERIVYHSRGVLHLLDPGADSPHPLDITLPGAPAGRRPRLLDPNDQLTSVRPDHAGDASLVEWWGNAFHLTHRSGPARVVAADDGVRVREPRLLGRTPYAIMITDADGEDALEIRSLTGGEEPRRLGSGEIGRVLHLTPSPSGAEVALVSHDGVVRVLVVADQTFTRVGHSTKGEATPPTWSIDGRYLIWGQPTAFQSHRQLVAVDRQQPGDPVELTSGRFDDFSPACTADGKYLAFLSSRTFDPSYDAHSFDLNFGASVRPWLIPLAATEPAPFGPSVDGWRLSTPGARASNPEGSPADSASADGSSAVTSRGGSPVEKGDPVSDVLDADGFEERIVAFPVASGEFRDLAAADGAVLWIREQPAGVLGAARAGVDGEGPGASLESFGIAERKVEVLLEQVDAYAVSGDGTRLVARTGEDVTVLPVGKPVAKDSPERVAVDLGRLRHELDPVAEWGQMFAETVSLMRSHYWRPDADGVDLAEIAEHYRPALARVASDDDLVDLLWEVVGEMNTSHGYIQPPGQPGDQGRRLGLLGADLALNADGAWQITRILPGESSDPAARSPLRAAGVNASVGDVVTAIGGRALDAATPPAVALVGTAETPVEITLVAPGGEPRRVVVVPLGDEEPLRYQEWVASRRAHVEEKSGGRLGYLHIPDMMSVGWAQLHRDIERATSHEGLIVDVRFNSGGHTSSLVIERLARRVLGWTTARHIEVRQPYPQQSPRGPVVLVANEYSGSDGDIVNAAAQAAGIGPVIGVRTWGGVVGSDGRFALVNGTGVTQPRYAFWLEGYGWGVENHGVDPDIEVVETPADVIGAGDVQLDRGISEALDRLGQTPAAQPPELAPPRAAAG